MGLVKLWKDSDLVKSIQDYWQSDVSTMLVAESWVRDKVLVQYRGGMNPELCIECSSVIPS
jgi:hypothetical protein